MTRGYINALGQTITIPERGVTKVATKADQAPLPNDYASAERPLPQLLYPPSQGEVAALVARLEAADIDPGNGVKAANAAVAAIEQHCAVAPGGRRFEMVLTTLTEDQLLAELRQSAADVLAHEELRLQGAKFVDQIAVEAAAALHSESDHVIKAMRPRFDAALKIVQAAAAAGLTPTTTAEQIIGLGDVAAGAFRALDPAVGVLDELGDIRDQLTEVAGVGPRDYPAAAWLATAETRLDIIGAAGVAAGSTQYVQQQGAPFGSFLAKVPVRRVGGRWLAVICAGYGVRLNSAREADALVANAKRTT